MSFGKNVFYKHVLVFLVEYFFASAKLFHKNFTPLVLILVLVVGYPPVFVVGYPPVFVVGYPPVLVVGYPPVLVVGYPPVLVVGYPPVLLEKNIQLFKILKTKKTLF